MLVLSGLFFSARSDTPSAGLVRVVGDELVRNGANTPFDDDLGYEPRSPGRSRLHRLVIHTAVGLMICSAPRLINTPLRLSLLYLLPSAGLLMTVASVVDVVWKQSSQAKA